MSKFNKGDIIQAKGSESTAVVEEVDLTNNEYKVRYINSFQGNTYSYSIDNFDYHWDLLERSEKAQENSCSCGMWSTYGKNCSKSFHSKWCNLNQ